MSDLISRSALLAYLENEKRKIKADSKKYRMHEEAVAGMKASLQAIENKVNEMPTAYDVKKVVAELKKMRNEDNQGCKRVQGWKCHSYSDCGLCIMDRTIDIVERVGWNENML